MSLAVTEKVSTVAVGETLELEMYALAYGGEGIAKHKGLVIFVVDALPGDVIQAKIVQVKKKFARGELLSIVKPSPDRIEPACPHAGTCGGCSWLTLAYPAQVKAKKTFVENALDHIGRLKAVQVLPLLKSHPTLGYRHKIQIPFQAGTPVFQAGFYARLSHTVVPFDECPIQPGIGNRLFKAVKQLAAEFGYAGYDEKEHQGLLRHLVIRIGANTKEILAILVTTVSDMPRGNEFATALLKQIPELVGVVQNVNQDRTNVILGPEFKLLAGKPFIHETIRGIRYRISAESFFQVNPFQMPALAEAVLKAADVSDRDTVIDLFCGVGFLTFELARKARRVFGIEYTGKAVEDAQTNKHMNDMANVEFFSGDAAQELAKLANKGLQPSVIVLDPPRKGCDPVLLKLLLKMHPQKIVYVSCNPVTLARDLVSLTSNGYKLQHVQPIDLFPHTYHIESVASLVRKK